MQVDPRRIVRRMLKEHTPYGKKESEDVVLIRKMLNAHPDIMSRQCRVGHITGSALVADQASQRILLHFHKRLKRWLQLGGHMDEGELNPAQTALREAREESGLSRLSFLPELVEPRPIDIDVHTIPATREFPEHLHLDFRFLLLSRDANMGPISSDESWESEWLPWPELRRASHLVDVGLLRLAEKAFGMLTDIRSTQA